MKKTCTVDSLEPIPAEEALNKKQYNLAESQFRALLAQSADNAHAQEGLVRTLLAEDKVDEAARQAEGWIATAPENSMARLALGDVRLRQGNVRGAYTEFLNAEHADLCNARAFFGVFEVDELAGLRASGKRAIEQAYRLRPTDDDIHTAWIWMRPRKERLALLAEYAEKSKELGDDDRTLLKTRLDKESLYHATDCRMAATSPREAKVPMAAVTDGPTRFLGWGLDVSFNGKKRRLQIDTGASGITISRAAAMFLGIQRQDATLMGGIGDKKEVKTSIAHVASVKIGGMEFTNCPVEILEKWSVLDSDGLIGGDVFDESQLTLDFPKHELLVSPLPERPGEKKADPGDDEEVDAHDPYVAPEMAKWDRIYRSGHMLLMPTAIVETKRVKDIDAWKDKLFLMDTGSDSMLISPSAAKEVTKVSRDSSVSFGGIQGEVDKVYEAGKFTLAFAGLRMDAPSTVSIDTTKISHDVGVEVSGFIGAPALFQVVMHIDYRDDLVWCEYTPNK
jgi:predicted aspartyl protease